MIKKVMNSIDLEMKSLKDEKENLQIIIHECFQKIQWLQKDKSNCIDKNTGFGKTT
jgi:hypothetical protein